MDIVGRSYMWITPGIRDILHVIQPECNIGNINLTPKRLAGPGREIAPNTGTSATKFFYFGNQILKISRQIGN